MTPAPSDSERLDASNEPALMRRDLDQAVLASERQRAGILACLFAACLPGMVSFLVLPVPMSEPFRAALVRSRPMWLPFYASATLYEVAVRALAGRSLRTKRQAPTAWRFANVINEISFPTLVTV